jgi:hypothetical protein
MSKLTISLVLAIAWALTARFTKSQLILDYTSNGFISPTFLKFIGSTSKKSLSIGFWMIVEMKSGFESPFIILDHSGVVQPEIFQFRTETATTYALYANDVRILDFKGSDSSDSFQEDFVARRAGTYWNYFAFNYMVSGSKTTITY